MFPNPSQLEPRPILTIEELKIFYRMNLTNLGYPKQTPLWVFSFYAGGDPFDKNNPYNELMEKGWLVVSFDRQNGESDKQLLERFYKVDKSFIPKTIIIPHHPRG